MHLQAEKVTVKFYVDGEKEAVATFETQLKAVDLSNATIDYTTPYQNYNGNIQRPASNELTVKLSGETVNSENYVVKSGKCRRSQGLQSWWI